MEIVHLGVLVVELDLANVEAGVLAHQFGVLFQAGKGLFPGAREHLDLQVKGLAHLEGTFELAARHVFFLAELVENFLCLHR